MSIKPQINQILGKTIESVVISKENKEEPRDQLFLIFTDGTSYEFYGELHSAGGLDSGGITGAINYLSTRLGGKMTTYIMDSQKPPEPQEKKSETSVETPVRSEIAQRARRAAERARLQEEGIVDESEKEM